MIHRRRGRCRALWRVESPRVIARLARLVGDLDTAEELAQDTFVAAIEKWRAGRGSRTTRRVAEHDCAVPRRRPDPPPRHPAAASTSWWPAPQPPMPREPDIDEIVDGDLADDLLGLIFMACHPILSPDARSALTLKLVCGLTTDEVARAFLTPEPTIAQRIVRAKRTLVGSEHALRTAPNRPSGPRASTPCARSSTWSSTRATRRPAGEPGSAATCARGAATRPDAGCSLTPNDTETLGLLALMELQASRLHARVGPDGEPVLLMDQDRDPVGPPPHPARARRASTDRPGSGGSTGPYALQAAIAACHARASPADGHRLVRSLRCTTAWRRSARRPWSS